MSDAHGFSLGRSAPVLRRLLDRYGLAPVRLRTLAAYGDVVVGVRSARADARLPPGGAVLRLYSGRDVDPACVQTEMDWLAAMAEDDLAVPRALADRDGRHVHSLRLGDGVERFAVLVGWVEGRRVDAGFTPARARSLGALIGAMHAHGDRLAAAGRLGPARIAHVGSLDSWARNAPTPAPIDERLRAVTVAAAARLRAELPAIAQRPGERGMVHADLHYGNTLYRGEQAAAIDFGICGIGPRVLDLAAALQAAERPVYGNHDHRPRLRRLRAALLDGYATRMRVPDDVEHQLELCGLARLFVTLTFTLFEWPHPDAYPWGATLRRECEAVFERYAES